MVALYTEERLGSNGTLQGGLTAKPLLQTKDHLTNMNTTEVVVSYNDGAQSKIWSLAEAFVRVLAMIISKTPLRYLHPLCCSDHNQFLWFNENNDMM